MRLAFGCKADFENDCTRNVVLCWLQKFGERREGNVTWGFQEGAQNYGQLTNVWRRAPKVLGHANSNDVVLRRDEVILHLLGVSTR